MFKFILAPSAFTVKLIGYHILIGAPAIWVLKNEESMLKMTCQEHNDDCRIVVFKHEYLVHSEIVLRNLPNCFFCNLKTIALAANKIGTLRHYTPAAF